MTLELLWDYRETRCFTLLDRQKLYMGEREGREQTRNTDVLGGAREWTAIKNKIFFLKTLFLCMDLKFPKCTTKQCPEWRWSHKNRAFHGSLDYSHFLLTETLPTKGNQQEKHRRQQIRLAPTETMPECLSCPTEKNKTKALCVSETALPLGLAQTESHSELATCFKMHIKAERLCCGSCCADEVVANWLNSNPSTTAEWILKTAFVLSGKTRPLLYILKWMEIREMKVREGDPSKVTGTETTPGGGCKGYQVSQWQIEAFNDRVWPADKGQHLFVVGFNAIPGDLFPHRDISTLTDQPQRTICVTESGVPGLLYDQKVQKQHPIPKKMSLLNLTTPNFMCSSTAAAPFWLCGLHINFWKSSSDSLLRQKKTSGTTCPQTVLLTWWKTTSFFNLLT